MEIDGLNMKTPQSLVPEGKRIWGRARDLKRGVDVTSLQFGRRTRCYRAFFSKAYTGAVRIPT